MATNRPALGVRHVTVVPTNFDPAADDGDTDADDPATAGRS